MGIAELRAAERSRFHSARQCVAQPQPGMGGRWPAVARSAPAGWPYGAKPAPTPIPKGCGGIEESVQRSKRRGEKKKKSQMDMLTTEGKGKVDTSSGTNQSCTMVVGGLLSLNSLKEATTWMADILQKLNGPKAFCS